MGAVRINLAEKRLLDYLASGGEPMDEVGTQLVVKFARTVWSDSSVNPIFRRYGFTETELAALYGGVVAGLMPEPWMNVSGPMLVPTGWFMEPHRIDNLLMEAERDAAGETREAWFEVLMDKAMDLARATRQIHDQTHGKPVVVARPTVKDGAGCAGIVVLFAGAVGSLGWVLLA